MSSSFISSYGKVNEVDQARLESRRQSRRRITIISLSCVVLVTIIAAAVIGGTSKSSKNHDKPIETNSISGSIKAVCDITLYPDSCYTSLSQATKNSSSSSLAPQQLFKLSIQVAMTALSEASQRLSKHFANHSSSLDMALNNCNELLALAADQLTTTLSSSNSNNIISVLDDLKTWLSASGTYQQTCIDGFENASEGITSPVTEYLKNSTEFTSNSLAIITGISSAFNSLNLRRLLSHSPNHDHKIPKWLSSKERRLLQSSELKTKADIVVAKDKSSKYKTISAALKAVPEKSKKRFVIYVKKGVYYENVRIEKTMWNVMMVGDGMNNTVVSGRLNVIDGTPTFSTATFAAFGKGFIARDMGFRNTAGPTKHQAVALMSSADESVFYRCSIDAFQDSLYTHAQRQFFRDCNIYGTVDFIFGNAAVVIQNCNILPRVPIHGQQNTITAQGKVDPNQNTGIVIQNCKISPFGNLTTVRTYLGRPWKPYSTTIFMQSNMGSFIDPAGWLPWNGTGAPDTIFYTEFQNSGPGSSIKNRVKWKGLKNITFKQANKFTVKSFINGDKWVSAAGFSYKSSL